MSNMSILLVCLGMGAVTYAPRVLPLLLFAGKEMPNWLKEALKFVPVAMLSALMSWNGCSNLCTKSTTTSSFRRQRNAKLVKRSFKIRACCDA